MLADLINVMDDEWFRAWAQRVPWKFASTMAYSPHWYTHRRQMPGDEFNLVVEAIRRHVWMLKFGRSYYKVYEIDRMIYWPMGFGGTATPVDKQFLINRTYYPTATSGVRVSKEEAELDLR